MARFSILKTEDNLPPQFVPAKRTSIREFLDSGQINQSRLFAYVEEHCVQKGQPLVISDMHTLKVWNHSLFDLEHLSNAFSDIPIEVFDMKTKTSTNTAMNEFINKVLGDRDSKSSPSHASTVSSGTQDSACSTSASTFPATTVLDDTAIEISSTTSASSTPSSTPFPTDSDNASDSSILPTDAALTNAALDGGSADSEPSKSQTTHMDTCPSHDSNHRPLTIRLTCKPMAQSATIRCNTGKMGALQVHSSNEIRVSTAHHTKLYAKDITCPKSYADSLAEIIPDFLKPLGPNDLFAHMPENLRAENLMCYAGSDGTGTALHRDICGTLGHNLMSYADPGAYAEWYFIGHEHRDALMSTFRKKKTQKGKDSEDAYNQGLAEQESEDNRKSSFIESDRVWVGQAPLKETNFKTQVVIQRAGDLVLIPSMCYHQVRNVGFSVKIAWNRATARSLLLAMRDQLPVYQSIVRPEIYRCKAMVYHVIKEWQNALRSFQFDRKGEDYQARMFNLPFLQEGIPYFINNCRILLHLFANHVIQPEMIEPIPFEEVSDAGIRKEARDMYSVVCDFCRADIFYRHFSCRQCDDYDLCMNCYVQGRGCKHFGDMVMCQNKQSLKSYVDDYNNFIKIANTALATFGASGLELTSELPGGRYFNLSGQYPLATICRRMQRFRETNGPFCNTLVCGHCNNVTDFQTLYENEGLDPQAVFGQKVCWTLMQPATNNIVFTCRTCTNACRDCPPWPKPNNESFQKIYYSSPSLDVRNWGGLRDTGIYKTSDWPLRPPTDIISSHEPASPESPNDESELTNHTLSALMQHVRPATYQRLCNRTDAENIRDLMLATATAWSIDIKSYHRYGIGSGSLRPDPNASWWHIANEFIDMTKVDMCNIAYTAPRIPKRRRQHDDLIRDDDSEGDTDAKVDDTEWSPRPRKRAVRRQRT